jgi:hypothetical protein
MVSTAQILAGRSLQQTCDQRCVDWAIALLESGHDSITICRLASMRPPHNHFELASLRDKVLDELGFNSIALDDAITMYAIELISDALVGRSGLDAVLEELKDMCIANDYQSNIHDFYLLYFARLDLREQDYQYYWPDADRSNIDTSTLDRMRIFVDTPQKTG